MKLTSSGSGEEEKQVAGSAASSSDMHPSRKRPRMTERGRAAEAAAEEFRRVYVLVLTGGDAEEFRRVYVLKKMFDKWSEAVLGYSWWGASRQEYQGHQSRRHLPRSGPLKRQM